MYTVTILADPQLDAVHLLQKVRVPKRQKGLRTSFPEACFEAKRKSESERDDKAKARSLRSHLGRPENLALVSKSR